MVLLQETVEGLAFAYCLLLDLSAFGEGGAVFEGRARGGGDELEDFVGYLASELRDDFEDFHGLVRYG